MYSIKEIKDAQFAINDIKKELDNFTKRNLDMHGFRIVNMGASHVIKDAVNRQELEVYLGSVRDSITVLRERVEDVIKRIERLENP